MQHYELQVIKILAKKYELHTYMYVYWVIRGKNLKRNSNTDIILNVFLKYLHHFLMS